MNEQRQEIYDWITEPDELSDVLDRSSSIMTALIHVAFPEQLKDAFEKVKALSKE